MQKCKVSFSLLVIESNPHNMKNCVSNTQGSFGMGVFWKIDLLSSDMSNSHEGLEKNWAEISQFIWRKMCNSNTWVTTFNKESLNSDCTLQHVLIWQNKKHSYISKDRYVDEQSCNTLHAFNSQQKSGKWRFKHLYI